MSSAEAVFLPCKSLDEYRAAVARFADSATSPVPVWTGARDDLLDGVALAEDVYPARGAVRPCATGVVLGDALPEPVLRAARPLALTWVTDVDDLPESGSVLVVGAYPELTAEKLRPLVDATHRSSRNLFLLTGRDVHSVSWMIAKQYAAPDARGPVGMFSALDSASPVPGVEWFGADDMRHRDIQGLALNRVWRRLLFHGNGTEDQLHLGQFTVCGLSPAGDREPGRQGPKCAFGLGCVKPEDKLVPARAVRAAELVLANCFSGPFADHGAYDPKYLGLLAAVDGPAQTVVATLFACDAQRPEVLAWLGAAERGSAARALNDRLADINPYPAFVQVGLQAPAAAHEPVVPGGEDIEDRDAAGSYLREVGGRLSGLLDSGLTAQDHPLRPRLRPLADTVLRDTVRTVTGAAPERRAALAAVAKEVTSLDLALAQRFAKHRDDPVFDFSTYFGERSVAEEWTALDAACACGGPLDGYLHRGVVPQVTDTVRGVCARCGDVYNALVGAPLLRVDTPIGGAPGTSITVRVEAVARRAGTVNLGIVPSPTIRVRVRPALRRVEVAAGRPARAEFTVEIEEDAVPQLYCLLPFAVHDLGIAVSRVYFTVAPDERERE
ncbi:hypothetical protein ACIOHE_36710 [Streptomyces sp. NPDC087851]|uniref:hypothetical protein n=1 Tax=Streptomyces sp. NPDC087851 TaxID=3365810 RepID=UPI003826174A